MRILISQDIIIFPFEGFKIFFAGGSRLNEINVIEDHFHGFLVLDSRVNMKLLGLTLLKIKSIME